jgi:hypothetical protein
MISYLNGFLLIETEIEAWLICYAAPFVVRRSSFAVRRPPFAAKG